MLNAEQAYPQIEITCEDRRRRFCLNLGGFRAMSEHLKRKHNDPDYDIFEDFDWSSTDLENISLMMFAGFYTDAKKDPEPFTIEKAEDITSLVGLSQARQCIEMSLQRAMSPQQYKKRQVEAEKKAKARATKSNKKKSS